MSTVIREIGIAIVDMRTKALELYARGYSAEDIRAGFVEELEEAMSEVEALEREADRMDAAIEARLEGWDR